MALTGEEGVASDLLDEGDWYAGVRTGGPCGSRCDRRLRQATGVVGGQVGRWGESGYGGLAAALVRTRGRQAHAFPLRARELD